MAPDFYVDNWLVSPATSTISRGDDRIIVKRKSVSVLSCLARSPGEIVTRDEIMEQVWPRVAVTDDVLTQSIVELRKAFSDDAKHPVFVETIPRVGFRLLAAVKPVPRRSPGVSVSLKQSVGAAAIVLVVAAIAWIVMASMDVTAPAGEKSIAVLPFVNMSDNPENAYFSEGVSEEILNLLARVPELKVIGRTSSFSFKDRNEDLREIGRALDVTTVLEGSVRRSGDRVRITAQLIDTASGAHIWSNSYDRTLTDIFDVQEDVAAAILGEMQVLTETSVRRGHPTDNANAYDLYLRARSSTSLFRTWDAENYLRDAISLNPAYAEAWELMAVSNYLQAGLGFESARFQYQMGEAANRALAINPNLKLARALYDISGVDGFTFLRQVETLENATLEQPNDPLLHQIYRHYLTGAGYHRNALTVARRLVELDPLSPSANNQLANTLYAIGETEEVLAVAEFAKQFGHRSSAWLLGSVYFLDGRDEEAAREFETHMSMVELPTDWIRPLIHAIRASDNPSHVLEAAIDTTFRDLPRQWEHGLKATLATWYLYLGELEHYFDVINTYELSDDSWSDAELLISEGIYFHKLGFTAHPRFLEVAEAIGLVEVWEARGAPDFCEKVGGKWVCE